MRKVQHLCLRACEVFALFTAPFIHARWPLPTELYNALNSNARHETCQTCSAQQQQQQQLEAVVNYSHLSFLRRYTCSLRSPTNTVMNQAQLRSLTRSECASSPIATPALWQAVPRVAAASIRPTCECRGLTTNTSFHHISLCCRMHEGCCLNIRLGLGHCPGFQLHARRQIFLRQLGDRRLEPVQPSSFLLIL